MFSDPSSFVSARASTFDIVDYFHPARGVGRTEAESQKRACEAVLLQGVLEESRTSNPKGYICLSPKYSLPRAPGELRYYPSVIRPVRSIDQPELCAQLIREPGEVFKTLEWVKSQRKPIWTKQPEQSGFSSGQFTRDDTTLLGADGGDEVAQEIQDLIQSIGPRLTHTWTAVQAAETADFIRTMERRDVPGPPSQVFPCAQPKPALSLSLPLPEPKSRSLSPISKGLMEPDGQLSPDSLAAAELVRSMGVGVGVHVRAAEPVVAEPGPQVSSDDDTSPASSPVKHAAERRRLQAFDPHGETLVRDSSQAPESSPEPEDQHTEDEAPRPGRTSPAWVGLSGTPAATVNPAKRRRTEDSISDADSAPVLPAPVPAGSRRPSARGPSGKPRLNLAPLPDRQLRR